MNLKKLLFILTILITTQICSFAQSPNWVWATSFGLNNIVSPGNCITSDISRNSIAVGCFDSTIAFGGTNLTSNGLSDIFVVKYDPNGNVLWAKSAGGSNSETAFSISVDANGNVVVIGQFYSPNINIDGTTLTNIGRQDIFIVKYDPNGNVLWAKSAGGSNVDQANSVSIDTSGNIVVAGQFNSPNIIFGSTNLTRSGQDDIFVVKYDSNGNILWAKSAGGSNYDVARSIKADVSGNIILTGNFASSTITFGSTILTNNGLNDIFIVKYDPSGNVLWAKSAGGSSQENLTSISTDLSGNCVITGDFYSSDLTFGNTILSKIGEQDIFVVKYDPNGNLLWDKTVGGSAYKFAISTSADISGNIIMAGYFESSLTIGSTTLSSRGNYDIFIVKYGSNGNILWAKSAGGMALDVANSITTDVSGDIVMTGYFGSSTITFGNTVLTKSGQTDMFVAKLSSTTGIDILTKETKVHIYPNPFNNYTHIELPNIVENAEIVISNLLGERILVSKISGKEYLLEKGTMSPGVYFVEINDEINRYPISKILVE